MYCIHLYVHFKSAFPKNKNNSYIGSTTTTLFRCLIYLFSENSAIKQHLIIKRNNSTNQFISSDVRTILTDNTIAQSAGAVKYTDCTSAEGKTHP